MTKVLSIILSLVLMFTFCIPPIFASETPEPEPRSTTFHADTIRQMIENNLELRNTDESFFHFLANAYLADPVLLIETIADLPGDDILYLAKAVSYDLHKTGRVSLAVLPAGCSPEITAIGKLIRAQIQNAENASLEAFYTEDVLSFIHSSDTSEPQGVIVVSKPTLSSCLADAQTTVRATYTITNNDYASSGRYLCKLYKTDGVTSTLIATDRVTKPANSTGILMITPFFFNGVGEFEIYVVVQDQYGTTVTSQHSDPAIATGKWQITVELTADRTQLGTITLFDGNGTQVSSSICLGKSAYNYPMNQTNGHTPMGIYSAILEPHYDENIKYGPYQVIKMTGVSGYIVDYCSHRYGIWIHGGREGYNSDPSSPSYPLYHTYGCVRVTNAYQYQLQTELQALVSAYHSPTGQVTVMQDGLTS